MTKDSMKFAIDVINEIVWDLQEEIYNCKNPNDVRRLDYVCEKLSLSVVQLTPLAFRKDE